MIGNMCKLDRDEWAACGNDALLERLRIFAELNDGDVLAESVCFICTVWCSGAFITKCYSSRFVFCFALKMVTDRIETGNTHEINKTNDCNWCEFE